MNISIPTVNLLMFFWCFADRRMLARTETFRETRMFVEPGVASRPRIALTSGPHNAAASIYSHLISRKIGIQEESQRAHEYMNISI